MGKRVLTHPSQLLVELIQETQDLTMKLVAWSNFIEKKLPEAGSFGSCSVGPKLCALFPVGVLMNLPKK